MDADQILVTGAAGFIGFHLSRRLLSEGHRVIGYDAVNDYYDPSLKRSRLGILSGMSGFRLVEADLCDRKALDSVFAVEGPSVVVNLAAQAGVRYSLTNPDVYISSNIQGFLNILELSRLSGVRHLVYASSSSVYGSNTRMPFSTSDNVDHPVSLYGATKKSNELMAHAYSHIYKLPTTGLRFFTVYGPWGRPDMALFLFTRAMLEGRPIDVFNNGNMQRDFTYVDDIVEGIIRVMRRPAAPNPAWHSDAPDPGSSSAPYKVYNIGNNNPVRLMDMIQALEACLGTRAICNFLPLQPGDVPATYADVSDLERDTGFKPTTSIQAGIAAFVQWYRDYYKIS